MPDIIQLLPEQVANQIAAGEVIQRPSSVVKELVENALDSGATTIKIIIKDAGKTLIQVIDDGCGMSDADARMAFERHATSKIKKATDLFDLHTMGFRGEALASIASVAQVELKTTLLGNELGTHLVINGGKFEKQEEVRTPVGSNFLVKNLFYNIPVRRKFLKPDNTERSHILTEIYRIALVHPKIAFTYVYNEVEVFNLDGESTFSRIGNLLGKKLHKQLVRMEADTSLVSIHGYVGVLSSVKKRRGEQFFFVNNRYVNHPYFHRAVMQAYDQLIPSGTFPPYFIHLKIDPSAIDVNIHPTKTEIKFEDEGSIFAIIVSAIRETLGKSNEIPGIDFDQADSVTFPLYDPHREIKQPEIKLNPNFNPFDMDNHSTSPGGSHSSYTARSSQVSYFDANEQIHPSYVSEEFAAGELNIPSKWNDAQSPLEDQRKDFFNAPTFFQFKGKYILTPSKSGMMLIDQHRAHYRILFEQYMNEMLHHQKSIQQLLFPEVIEVSEHEKQIIREFASDFKYLGFLLVEDPHSHFYKIEGIPADLSNKNPVSILAELLDHIQLNETDLRKDVQNTLAKNLAKISAIKAGHSLSIEEMNTIFDQLFACEIQVFSPDGKPIISIIEMEYIEQLFK